MAENTNTPPVDEQISRLGDAIAQKADRMKYILLAVLVVLIAVAAIVSFAKKSAARREAAAKDKVYETIAGIQNEKTPVAEGAAAFGQAARDFSGTTAGAQASLLQFAYSYNENKDYAGAEKAAEQFVKTYPRNKMIPRARYALAQAILQQGRVDDAITVFRSLVALEDPEILPETKLALAQALERRAEQVKDNPGEYRTRLEAAEAEYNDIITRSQISVPSQRGFWPQAVTLPADYALVQLKDRLNGHVHGTPRGAEPAVATPPAGVMTIPPPPSDNAAAEAAPESEAAAPVDAEDATETGAAAEEPAAATEESSEATDEATSETVGETAAPAAENDGEAAAGAEDASSNDAGE